MTYLPAPSCATALLAIGLWITPAGADPMRPLPTPGKASAAVTAPGGMTRQADRPPTLGRLIAIRLDSQGRRHALIGERWVSVGDTLEQARVTAIGGYQVELAFAGPPRPSVQTLHLLPTLQAGGGAPAATGSKTR